MIVVIVGEQNCCNLTRFGFTVSGKLYTNEYYTPSRKEQVSEDVNVSNFFKIPAATTLEKRMFYG